MMGSAATRDAAAARRLRNQEANDAFREKKRQLALDKQRAALDARQARLGAKTDRIATVTDVIAQRADTETEQLLIPTQTQAGIDASDAESRAKIMKAIPWIIGGVVAVGAVIFLRKRAKGRAS